MQIVLLDANPVPTVYPGIFLQQSDKGNQWKFTIAPYTDLSSIQLGIEGANHVSIDSQGALVIEDSKGLITRSVPQASQRVKGKKYLYPCRFQMRDTNVVDLAMGVCDPYHSVTVEFRLEHPMHSGVGNQKHRSGGGSHPNLQNTGNSSAIHSLSAVNGSNAPPSAVLNGGDGGGGGGTTGTLSSVLITTNGTGTIQDVTAGTPPVPALVVNSNAPGINYGNIGAPWVSPTRDSQGYAVTVPSDDFRFAMPFTLPANGIYHISGVLLSDNNVLSAYVDTPANPLLYTQTPAQADGLNIASMQVGLNFSGSVDSTNSGLNHTLYVVVRNAVYPAGQYNPVGLSLQATAIAGYGAIRPDVFLTQNPLSAYDDCADGSTPASGPCPGAVAVPMGFTVNFFGTNYSQVFVNNNGNVTFGTSQGRYTPQGLTGSDIPPILAPFFADVDTRGSITGGNVVTYGSGTVHGRPAWGVNWKDVGYYSIHNDKLNLFQLVIIDRSDTGAGNFDYEYNYGRCLWETGDASNGSNGFGGYSAYVGFADGHGPTGINYLVYGSGIPGSLEDSNLSTGLIHGRYRTGVLGRYVFSVRNGAVYNGPNDMDDDPGNGGQLPAAPTALTATAVSAAQINLGWTDTANDQSGFLIERKLVTDVIWQQIANVGASVFTYADTGLSASTTYQYRVRAYNSVGTSPYTNVASATTFGPPPPPPDFSLSASPGSLSIVRGSSGSSTITVNPIGGFTGSVNLAASGLPTGVSAAFGQNPTSGSSILTLAVGASVAAGTYPITVTGTSGSLTHTVTVTLTITTGGNPDYALVPNPTTLTIPQGGSGTDTITVVPSNGWTSSVALSATSATSGITASLSTSPVAVNGTSTLTVSVASSVPPGAYSVTVNGMSGSQAGQNNHSINIPVTVTGGGGIPDFTLSASPASVSVAAPGSGTTTIMVNPIGGFNGSVSLSASGLPSGVTAGFSPASTTTTSVLTFTADGTAGAGTYPVTVMGTSGNLTRTVTVNLTVTTGGGSSGSTYLQSLTVDHDCLFGGGSVVGTVQLNRITTTPLTVALTSTSSNILFPPSVTIPAGSSSAAFSITVPTPSTAVVCSLYASLANWMQKVKIAAVPALANVAITDPNVTVGSGAAWINWNGIEDDLFGKSLLGYVVYRSTNGSPFVALNAVPTTSSSFTDTTIGQGTYTYRVCLISDSGIVNTSTDVVVTGNGIAADIAWLSTPPSQVTGTISLSATNPDITQESYMLYVDGIAMGAGVVSDASAGGTSTTIDVSMDTTLLSNGAHSMWLASDSELPSLHASSAVSFSVSNSGQNTASDDIVETQLHQYCEVAGRLSNAVGGVTVSIQNAAGVTVRSWQGDGNDARVVWDGKDENGVEVADGSYVGSVADHGSPSVSKTFWNINKMATDPNFLAIVTIPQEKDFPNVDVTSKQYAIQMRGFLKSIRDNQEPGMSYAVFPIADKEYVSRNKARTFYRWLGGNTPGNNLSSGSVRYFYLCGHGNRPLNGRATNHFVFIGANMRLYNYRERNSNWGRITIPNISRPGQYQFVWLDCCHTVGGDKTSSPPDPWVTFMTQYPNLQWQSAFKLTGGLGDDAFMGTNGQMYFCDNNPADGLGYAWYQWRLNFWTVLAFGYSVSESIIWADEHPRGSGHPTPLDFWGFLPKLQQSGDYKW